MASDAGISTNTLLVVAALGVVAVVMWQRRGGYGAPRAAAADARPGGMGGMGGSGFTAADVKTLTEAAIGLGEGIRRWSTDENEDAALSSANVSYLATASPAALTFCVERGYVDAQGNPTPECVATYDG